MPFKSINHGSWKKLLLFPQHVQVNGLALIAQAYIYNYKQKNSMLLIEIEIIYMYVWSTSKFQKQNCRLQCRIKDFNPPHPQGVLGQDLISVGSVANQNEDMCAQMTMKMMKLNHDQKRFNILCHLVIYQELFYNVFVLKKVLLNLVEETDNNHRRSRLCFIYWEY